MSLDRTSISFERRALAGHDGGKFRSTFKCLAGIQKERFGRWLKVPSRLDLSKQFAAFTRQNERSRAIAHGSRRSLWGPFLSLWRAVRWFGGSIHTKNALKARGVDRAVYCFLSRYDSRVFVPSGAV